MSTALKNNIALIKNETQPGKNTAVRVGSTLQLMDTEKRDVSDSYSKSQTLDMINQVKALVSTGTQSIGTIKPADTIPAGDLWAFAEAGTYPNANGIVIPDGAFGIVTRIGGTWAFTTIEADINSIEDIQKTGTVGLVDTYRISMTNGSSFDFEVTNGETVNIIQSIDTDNVDDAVSGKAVADYVPKKFQSDNLFNGEDAVLDKYFPYNEPGYLYPRLVFDAAGRYITQKITVKPNTKYIKNQGSVGFFDADDRMIIGYPESALSPITSPANTAWARFTGFQSALETTVFVEGETLISYETGSKTVDLKYLPPSVLSRKGNTIIISKNGGGDYRHINDAIDWLRDNGESDLNNLFTFELLDGNYIESVNMIGLYASIIGRNKENCTVRTYTNDYKNPPFDIAGNNNLSNLTIIADDDGQTTPPLGVNNTPAYGIHYDVAGRLENLGSRVQGRAIVKNCRVIGKHQHAIALGLWKNQYLEIDDTEMYSAERAAFRAHNYSTTAEEGQQLLVRNCRMSNPRWNAGTTQNPDMQNWAIMLQDPNLAGDTLDRTTIFSFQNNIAWVEGQQSQTGLLYRNSGPLANPNGETLVGHILHGVDSFGNNIAELNF